MSAYEHPTMQPTRREFIKRTGATLLASAWVPRATAADPVPPTPLDVVRGLLGPGFDPAAPDSALLAVIADPHIFLGAEYPQYQTDRWDDGLIGEINSLAPVVTDLILAGDLISYHSMTPGLPRFPSHVVWSKDEFRAAKREMARFSSSMRQWAIPGNHDTDAFETDAELWREQLGLPAYQQTVLGGVPVFFLNSGNGGMLDAVQHAWFLAEAAKVPEDQEVVVVVHHPCFTRTWEQSAVKRILTNVFGGRTGTVWVVSGHDHLFADLQFVHRGTRFVQMEVTAANPKSSADGKSPGYILLALQSGQVVKRLFRSLKDPGFVDKDRSGKAVPTKVKFQFDDVPYCAEAFEEGFYERTDRVIAFNGVDVGSYLTYLKNVTFQVRPPAYRGNVKELVLAGTISASITPVCSISQTGAAGTWEPVPFPVTRGVGLFRLPIPESYRQAETYLVKVETGLTGTVEGFSLSGWALAADPTGMSGFEKWLYGRFHTTRKDAQAQAGALTPGTNLSNVVNFGFNLLPAVDGLLAATDISGQPASGKVLRQVFDFRFARRRAETQPGITYTIERSLDLRTWRAVAVGEQRVTPLDAGWEEVAVSRLISTGERVFHRVSIDQAVEQGLGFAAWGLSATVPAGQPGDLNADGIDDLVQYAFELSGSEGGARHYDPTAPAQKGGLPAQTCGLAPVTTLVFPRMKASANPGVTYTLESSLNQIAWTVVPSEQYLEQVRRTQGDWEEVEITIPDGANSQWTYRIGVAESAL